MFCNYHAHTVRCHHAEGTEREYIERAIEGGIKKMGFSDHIPFVFPDGHESGYRVSVAQAEEYVAAINALKEEYKDRIELHVGFESEYYPLYFDKMYENAVRWGAEYLILGQHFIRNEFPQGFYCGWQTDDNDHLKIYCDEVVEAIGKGVFTYVAHPDIFNFSGDREFYRGQVRRICEAAKEHGTPLEINMLGIRTNRHYPNEDFWQVAGEVGCTAVLGFDAHEAKDACDAESIPKAEALAAKYGVAVEDDPVLVPLRATF